MFSVDESLCVKNANSEPERQKAVSLFSSPDYKASLQLVAQESLDDNHTKQSFRLKAVPGRHYNIIMHEF